MAVISSDLLDRLAATDRLDGDSGLEFGTVGFGACSRRYPASEVEDGACPEKPIHLTRLNQAPWRSEWRGVNLPGRGGAPAPQQSNLP
jgi:hypothetical protein